MQLSRLRHPVYYLTIRGGLAASTVILTMAFGAGGRAHGQGSGRQAGALATDNASFGWRGTAKIEGPAREITTADLASALGVQWWSYRPRFSKPVKGIMACPCEPRRKPDGTWERKDLDFGIGWSPAEGFREIDIALFIPRTPEGKEYILKLDTLFQKGRFQTPPGDFGKSDSRVGLARMFQRSATSTEIVKTYSRVSAEVRMIAGCLVLSWRERDPIVVTGREEYMTWLFGLYIETNE